MVRLGLDAEDEGYFVEQTTRVLQGQLPYRDFDSLYTPALLYIHAASVTMFGGSPIIDLRIVGLVARLVLAVGLYLLCKPVVRPAIAVLPSLYVLVALDRVPSTWEPHPAWPSASLTILAIWAFMRLPSTYGIRRHMVLIIIGAMTALVFALKQNAGVLLGLALVVSTAWQGIDATRTEVSRTLRVIQLLLFVVVVAATAWLIQPNSSPIILAYFLIPLVAAGFASILPVQVSANGRPAAAWFRMLGWLGLGWSVVSLPWLIALLSALDWNAAPIKGFIGLVNQEVLWYPLQGPDGGAWASLLGLAVALLAAVRHRRRPLLCAAAVVMMIVFAVSTVVLTRRPGEPGLLALVFAPGQASDGVALFLPVACIVGGVVGSLRSRSPGTAWWLRCMTVASALTFLSEYPRVDEVHLTWSACLPLATGAVVLARLHKYVTRRWRATGASRYLVAVALLLVPAATVLRSVGIRSQGFVDLRQSGWLPVQLASTVTLKDPASVAGLVVPTDQADTLIAASQFVASNTSPGEPIFVYPTSPLVYGLANRPNPTRFAHLYPGAASASELDQLMVTLDQIPVNLVVVSESDLAFWGPARENASLEAYLVSNYHEIVEFGPYRVLRRH